MKLKERLVVEIETRERELQEAMAEEDEEGLEAEGDEEGGVEETEAEEIEGQAQEAEVDVVIGREGEREAVVEVEQAEVEPHEGHDSNEEDRARDPTEGGEEEGKVQVGKGDEHEEARAWQPKVHVEQRTERRTESPWDEERKQVVVAFLRSLDEETKRDEGDDAAGETGRSTEEMWVMHLRSKLRESTRV